MRFRGIAPCRRNHLSNNLYFEFSCSLEREGVDLFHALRFLLGVIKGLEPIAISSIYCAFRCSRCAARALKSPRVEQLLRSAALGSCRIFSARGVANLFYQRCVFVLLNRLPSLRVRGKFAALVG